MWAVALVGLSQASLRRKRRRLGPFYGGHEQKKSIAIGLCRPFLFPIAALFFFATWPGNCKDVAALQRVIAWPVASCPPSGLAAGTPAKTASASPG